MRIRHLATIACCVALLSATSLSVRGQQDPLPPVMPKNGVTAPPSEIILTSGAVAVYAPATLGDAAANNDYLSFAALYNALRTRGDGVDAYTPLYDLWTWSLSDPVGAFYGRETYERLARAYPAFATYISAYAIVDNAGNTYWPTSETRAFLLERALAGESTKILVAEAAPRREARAVVIESAPAPTPAPRRARTSRPRSRVAKNGSTRGAGVSPAPAARPAPPLAKPEPVTEKPVVETTVAEKPVVETTVAEATVAETTVPPTAVVQTPAPMPQTAPPPTETAAGETPAAGERDARPPVATAETAKPWTNGIFMLLLLGVIGVGLFALLMRTPKEEKITTISMATEKPPATVEPITKFTPAGGTRGSESPGSGEPQQHSPSTPDRSLRDGDVRGRRR